MREVVLAVTVWPAIHECLVGACDPIRAIHPLYQVFGHTADVTDGLDTLGGTTPYHAGCAALGSAGGGSSDV